MTTFRMQESKFGAPMGMYVGRFLGVKSSEHPEYGAGTEWRFEIVEGEYAGRIVSRSTAPQPSQKNSCRTLLEGVIGRSFGENDEIDIAAYIGRHYRVYVGPKAGGKGTRLDAVQPLPAGYQPAQAGTHQAPPPANRPPEVRWVDLGEGQQPKQMTRAEIQAVVDRGTNPALVMIHDGGEWKPATSFGIKAQPASAPLDGELQPPGSGEDIPF